MPAPPDGAARLQALVPFARLDEETRQALAADVEWLWVPAGRRLFSTGDAPDGMYGILAGRVRFFLDADGVSRLTADAGPGITFGEGSLLVGGGRSRTAVVARDALLVRIPPERFASLMARSDVSTGVARLLAARFATPLATDAHPGRPAVIAVDAMVEPTERRWLLDELTRAVGAGVHVVAVDGADPDSIPVLRQADDVVLVRRADPLPYGLERVTSWWSGVDPLATPPVDLVLLRGTTAVPGGVSSAWARAVESAAPHHVRSGSATDVARVGRLLAGTAVGLVLGGGGARGMAHIGVLRALDELGIPVDVVGGSSMGAVVGGEHALGRSWSEVLEESERVWRRRSLRLDLTVPTVSVSSGRRARRIFDELFGAVRLEDFPVAYFCTTTNLSRCELSIHRDGPAAQWIRASASAPGLWPPVVDAAGELHVDGGQLDNVPTDVMRSVHGGRVIAVDVCATQQAMTVDPGAEPPVGIRHVLRRRGGDRFPSLVDTVNRCALLSSLQQQARAAGRADVYLTPDVATVGFGGFARIREAVEIGYRTTLEAFADGWPPMP